MIRSIPHITLDTGDVQPVPRSEVDERAIASVQSALDRAISGEGQFTVLGYPMVVRADRESLVATVLTSVDGKRPVPMVTFGVAAGPLGAAELWQTLHQDRAILPPGGYPTTRGHAPLPPPWLAVRMEIGAAMTTPAVLRTIADHERVIAWAWLSRMAPG